MLSLTQSEPVRPKKAIQIAPTVQNDVFLNAILEMPTNVRPRRSPLQWAGAAAVHIGIIAALVIVPLYTTGAVHLSEFEETHLVAPPPPPPPPPLAKPVAPRTTHPRPQSSFKEPKFLVPTAIPTKVSTSTADQAAAPPPLNNLAGIPNEVGGVAGGQIGGVLGGVLGGVGTATPPRPPSQPTPTKKLLRVGSGIKAPRQTYYIGPVYPVLALETRISGTVLVDAIIDEHGNVVQAHATSGHPLLIPPALQAVLQWKYEPTSLNGQPVSVELQVQVHFEPRKAT